MYSCLWNSISQLRSVTCHMGSHCVTCHPTQVNTPRLNPSQTGRYSIFRPRRDRRLSWPRWHVFMFELYRATNRGEKETFNWRLSHWDRTKTTNQSWTCPVSRWCCHPHRTTWTLPTVCRLTTGRYYMCPLGGGAMFLFTSQCRHI